MALDPTSVAGDQRPGALPAWFRQPLPDPARLAAMRELLRGARLNTVCQGAACPNLGACWQRGVATFMILGDVCTRACRFCAVTSGRPRALDAREPAQVAAAVRDLGLRYVVVTSVTRDDLPDGGAGHFARVLAAIRDLSPETKIETLIPDFGARPESLAILAQAGPDVAAHNIETVRRLSSSIRPQADYDRSLRVLRDLRARLPKAWIKSSIMLGLGETAEDLRAAWDDLLACGCDILTMGQYLCPSSTSSRHVPVQRFVTPDEFADYRETALRMGFKSVTSGPLVRSSYMAEQGYDQCAGLTLSTAV